MVTRSAPEPPPENDVPTAAARGPTEPSARFTSVASGRTQPPSAAATRTGTIDFSKVSVLPSGLANTVSCSVRSSTTSTRSPVAAASAMAFSEAVGAAASDGAALARPAASGIPGTRVSASASVTPAPAKRAARPRVGLMRVSI
ncbi:hypothetical protein [Streptomyces sp. Act143]|uniref:hypothetical protein n=1 Tax=Streptomyces sp. Act143 TaxID=2200760 RepID=UPI0015E81CCE|nr:hypothetical protein [Streptomyces sp. Act143]